MSTSGLSKKGSAGLTFAIFLGLLLGIVFGRLVPGRFEFLLPAVDLVSSL